MPRPSHDQAHQIPAKAIEFRIPFRLTKQLAEAVAEAFNPQDVETETRMELTFLVIADIVRNVIRHDDRLEADHLLEVLHQCLRSARDLHDGGRLNKAELRRLG
jgi:hypothetical protein